MQPIWSTKQDFFTEAKISFVLSSRLAAFPWCARGLFSFVTKIYITTVSVSSTDQAVDQEFCVKNLLSAQEPFNVCKLIYYCISIQTIATVKGLSRPKFLARPNSPAAILSSIEVRMLWVIRFHPSHRLFSRLIKDSAVNLTIPLGH